MVDNGFRTGTGRVGELAVFVAAVLAVQLLFMGTEPPSSLITITALVLVSLIALPARDRLQLLADRIVFGRRSTAYHALASFAEMSAGAWSLHDTAPRLAGLLAPGRPVRPAERRLIGQLSAQAALVFETLRLTSELSQHADALAEQAVELRRSRLRLVRAQDAERNRIGRDLHDGSQQHLVAIIAKAGLARSQLTRDIAVADGTLVALQLDTKSALTEFRELVHGVFPPILADRVVPARRIR